ncbi:hypothetical protein phiAS5_ORF0324 [Aeromonas phage phiAS5]|uniref:Uncharacterized protein n=1 Tax=Aeromonas phage phiAS5 TaxID=879630 RepID=E1A278_9CAUD|nr:hypothetical protein phiAS5_ORF0324 [Aeromonas phage phiAS5]ADM80167.1 hypothetical protein phiAS5_ORF0324 [Aeromonas phage phiAS5]BES53071.1 hypothetical protein [Aeromonas phage phiWae14]
MREANEILEDSSLKLAVQLDDTRKQARDLETAFDMTTDSSLDVAKAEDGLVKSINAKNKATERATDYIDTVAYSQRASAEIESDYQKALQRRTELENKIAKQGEIIRFSEQVASQQTPGTPTPVETPAEQETPVERPKKPEDVDEELKKFLKSKGLSSRKEFEDLKKKNKEAEQEAKSFTRKVGESVARGIVSSTMGGLRDAASMMTSGLENALVKDIPGYREAKSLLTGAAKGTGKFVRQVGGHAVEKFKESRFERQREKAVKEFRATTEVNTTGTGEQQAQEERVKKSEQEQKQERGENKRERGENEKRHKSLIDTLKDLGKMMLLSGIGRMLLGLATSISGLAGGLFTRFGSLLMKLGSLGAGIASAMTRSLSGLFQRAFPSFGKTKTPDVDIDGKKKPSGDIDTKSKTKAEPGKPRSTVEVDANGKPKASIEPGKTPDVDMRAGQKAGAEVAEDAASKTAKTAAKEGGESFFKRMTGKVGLKGAAKVVGRVATKFIPFVGTALLLSDLYDLANYVSDGKVDEMVGNAGDFLKEKLTPVSNIQAGMPSASDQVENTEESVKKAQEAKAARDKKRDADAARAYMANSTQINNNNTTIQSAPFAFAPDNMYSNHAPFGVQSR